MILRESHFASFSLTSFWLSLPLYLSLLSKPWQWVVQQSDSPEDEEKERDVCFFVFFLPLLLCAPISSFYSCFWFALFSALSHIQHPAELKKKKKKTAMKEAVQMENHSWRETAKNMGTFWCGQIKATFSTLSLSLSLKMMLKDLRWLTARCLFQSGLFFSSDLAAVQGKCNFSCHLWQSFSLCYQNTVAVAHQSKL